MEQKLSPSVLEPFMAKLDFVQWDRYTNGGFWVTVFGWIPRPDGRSDFVLLDWEEGRDDTPWYWTSSAEYSEEIARRIDGDADNHASCQRVEHAGLSLPNVIRLSQTPPPHSMDVCECGDYRKQHLENNGACMVCKWSPTPTIERCKSFRLFRRHEGA